MSVETPPRPGSPLLQSVEPDRDAGHYLVPRLGGQRPEPLADHLRRAREEAVLMRIIGRPHDLVRADIVGQSGDRDTAIDRQDLAGNHAGFVAGEV